MLLYTLSMPAKTFLLGEYAALAGGPCIIMNTKPRFKLVVRQQQGGINSGIPPHSPAEHFIQLYQPIFANYQLKFIDPYQHLGGGLGASSAQFALVYTVFYLLQNDSRPLHLRELLQSYAHHAQSSSRFQASGADLAGQWFGKICFWDKNKSVHQVFDWPFPEHDIFLLKTPLKIQTHQHLNQITTAPPLADLTPLVYLALEAIQNKSAADFMRLLAAYRFALQRAGLVTAPVKQLLLQLEVEQGVKSTKGCGALGADVIGVMTHKSNSTGLLRWCEKHKLRLIANQNDISSGILIEDNPNQTAILEPK